MKRILLYTIPILLLCVITIIFLILNFQSENLYPINNDKGGGYINKNGEIKIKQTHNFAFRFAGNYAIVEGKNLKKGIINKRGRLVIDYKYDDLYNLSENFVSYKENGKYGFINIPKKKKFDAIYDQVKPYKEGLAGVCIDGKWGFINKNGKVVIKPKYYDVANFNEGLAAVSNICHTTAGYIDRHGEMIISFKDNKLEPKEFHEGLAPVINGNDESCSYINKKGKVVISRNRIRPMKVYCGNFSNGLNVFFINNNNRRKIATGYIDKKGKIKYAANFSLPKNMSSDEFSAYDEFSSGMARITIDYQTGYLNKNFKTIIPPVFEFARDFDGDLAYVKYKDKEGYINKLGRFVWEKPREGM